MISPDWNQKQISQAELEEAFEPNIIDEWAIAFSSALYFKSSKVRGKLLLNSGIFIFVGLLFLFPIVLIPSRSLKLFANSSIGFILILLICILILILLLIAFYWYLYKQAKRAKNLTALVNKVEQYNQLISRLSLLANIREIASSKADINSANTTELKSILNSTKNSLLESIKLESYIYRHYKHKDASNYPCNPQQLLAQLEDDLASILLSKEQNTEYQQLLENAVDIGLSVQQEMRKIWNLRRNS